MPPIARVVALICLGASPLVASARAVAADDRAYHATQQRAPESRQPASKSGNWPPRDAPFESPSSGVLPAVFDLPAGGPSKSPPAASPRSAVAVTPLPRRAPEGPGTMPAAGRNVPLPLPPRDSPQQSTGNPAGGRPGGVASAVTVASSLAVVLGLFFLLAWMMRRTAPRGLTALPTEVVEVLGRAPLAGRQQVHLVRCGAKLLLVSVTPTGAETLTEITDPDEVNRLAGLCHQARPGSATATFREVFGQLSREGSVLGLLGGSRRRESSPGDFDREDGTREGRDG